MRLPRMSKVRIVFSFQFSELSLESNGSLSPPGEFHSSLFGVGEPIT